MQRGIEDQKHLFKLGKKKMTILFSEKNAYLDPCIGIHVAVFKQLRMCVMKIEHYDSREIIWCKKCNWYSS